MSDDTNNEYTERNPGYRGENLAARPVKHTNPKDCVPPRVMMDMKDSGERQEFESGMVRDITEGKPRPDLISPFTAEREGIWLAKGAKKYSERNWEKGCPIARCMASLERHLMAYKMGKTDEDHMAALRCNSGFILHFEEAIKHGFLPEALDDMPKYLGDKNSDRE